MSESKQQKSSKPNFELPTHRAPNPEEVERYIKERPELSRPFILPNHQKHLVAVTWLSCAAFAFYFVFWHDFQQQEHCFSGIRRYASRLKERIFSVGEEEEDAVQKRIEELQKKIEAKKNSSKDDVIPT